MLTKTQAIVLHTVKYGDSQLIVDMLTRAHGRVAFMQNVSASGRGKIKKQMFQPLTLLDLEYDARPKARLQRIKDVRLLAPYTSIPFDPYKLSLAIFVAEFLTHATRNEQANGPLFEFVATSIQWLDGSGSRFANFHLAFMMRLSLFIGFWPNTDGAVREGAFFDMRNACFTPTRPSHSDFLWPEDAARLASMLRMRYENMHLYKMSRAQRNACVDVILKYYRLHLPDFPDLRSLGVMQELFA